MWCASPRHVQSGVTSGMACALNLNYSDKSLGALNLNRLVTLIQQCSRIFPSEHTLKYLRPQPYLSLLQQATGPPLLIKYISLKTKNTQNFCDELAT